MHRSTEPITLKIRKEVTEMIVTKLKYFEDINDYLHIRFIPQSNKFIFFSDDDFGDIQSIYVMNLSVLTEQSIQITERKAFAIGTSAPMFLRQLECLLLSSHHEFSITIDFNTNFISFISNNSDLKLEFNNERLQVFQLPTNPLEEGKWMIKFKYSHWAMFKLIAMRNFREQEDETMNTLMFNLDYIHFFNHCVNYDSLISNKEISDWKKVDNESIHVNEDNFRESLRICMRMTRNQMFRINIKEYCLYTKISKRLFDAMEIDFSKSKKKPKFQNVLEIMKVDEIYLSFFNQNTNDQCKLTFFFYSQINNRISEEVFFIFKTTISEFKSDYLYKLVDNNEKLAKKFENLKKILQKNNADYVNVNDENSLIDLDLSKHDLTDVIIEHTQQIIQQNININRTKIFENINNGSVNITRDIENLNKNKKCNQMIKLSQDSEQDEDEIHDKVKDIKNKINTFNRIDNQPIMDSCSSKKFNYSSNDNLYANQISSIKKNVANNSFDVNSSDKRLGLLIKSNNQTNPNTNLPIDNNNVNSFSFPINNNFNSIVLNCIGPPNDNQIRTKLSHFPISNEPPNNIITNINTHENSSIPQNSNPFSRNIKNNPEYEEKRKNYENFKEEFKRNLNHTNNMSIDNNEKK